MTKQTSHIKPQTHKEELQQKNPLERPKEKYCGRKPVLLSRNLSHDNS